MAFVALLDANVLYPGYMTDLLLRLAQSGVYQPRRTTLSRFSSRDYP